MGIKGFSQRPLPSGATASERKEPPSYVQVNFKELDAFIRPYALSFASALYPNGKLVKNQWCVGSIHGHEASKQGSFRLTVEGQYIGLGKEFSPSGARYNENLNLIQIWAERYGVSIPKAAEEIIQFLGLKPADFRWNNPFVEVERLRNAVSLKASTEQLFAGQSANNSGAHTQPVEIAGYKVLEPVEPKSPAHPYALKTMRDNLRNNVQATNYLIGRGLSELSIKQFSLGLNGQTHYSGKQLSTPNALIFPIINVSGTAENRYAFYNIPGLTENPMDDNGWCSGTPTAYCSGKKKGQPFMVVCEGMKDLWRMWEFLYQNGISEHFWLVTSTHGSNPPWEAFTADFWQGHQHIILSYDNDDAGNLTARKVSELAYRVAQVHTRRLFVPKECGKDLTNYFNSMAPSKTEFKELLKQSAMFNVAAFVEDVSASKPTSADLDSSDLSSRQETSTTI